MTAAPSRRFDIILTGDSLRLGSVKDQDRCVLTLAPGGAEADVGTAVRVHLPKEDRRAYARAARAFNKTMDRHEQRRSPESREIDPRHETLRAAVRLYHGDQAAD